MAVYVQRDDFLLNVNREYNLILQEADGLSPGNVEGKLSIIERLKKFFKELIKKVKDLINKLLKSSVNSIEDKKIIEMVKNSDYPKTINGTGYIFVINALPDIDTASSKIRGYLKSLGYDQENIAKNSIPDNYDPSKYKEMKQNYLSVLRRISIGHDKTIDSPEKFEKILRSKLRKGTVGKSPLKFYVKEVLQNVDMYDRNVQICMKFMSQLETSIDDYVRRLDSVGKWLSQSGGEDKEYTNPMQYLYDRLDIGKESLIILSKINIAVSRAIKDDYDQNMKILRKIASKIKDKEPIKESALSSLQFI